MKIPHSISYLLTACLALAALTVGTTVAHAEAANWPSYLASLKQDSSNGVKAAAIYSLDGSKLAADVAAKPGEIAALADGLKNIAHFKSGGINFGGSKYVFVTTRSPEGVVGKLGSTSIVVRPTGKGLLIVLTKDNADGSRITSVDAVADRLKAQGL